MVAFQGAIIYIIIIELNKRGTMKHFLNKEVEIFPNDSYTKCGIVIDVDAYGVTIKITSANKQTNLKKGDTLYYSHSKPLVLKLV